MKSYIFITETGCDPQLGKPVKDPGFGRVATFGACRPDIRRWVVPGDRIFVASGKVDGAEQYVLGCLKVADKISAQEAFRKYPEHRLRRSNEGHVLGNIVCDQTGSQHRLDHHRDFANRIENYIVGSDEIEIVGDKAVAAARSQTLEFLRNLLGKNGDTLYSVMGRASRLDQSQTKEMLHWLRAIQRTR